MNAVEYWMGELANRSEGTRNKYMEYFTKFCEWIGKSANQLIDERKEDLKSDDPREQRRMESSLKGFMAYLEKERMSVATRQVAYAAIRSFFEMHFQPLRMRRGDYPTGESLGSRVATKEDIKQILRVAPTRIKALILFMKDTGLRVSDIIRLKYGDISEKLENDEEFIPLQLITKKNKITAKTFLGPESIEALKEYFQERREGNRNIPPETITTKSPLFRIRDPKVKPISRSGMSSIITFYATKLGINSGFSAHSFRKYFQTALEASGTNTNWIDQMIGHRLINSRDSYSKPNCAQLLESYKKAYLQLRVFKEKDVEKRVETLEEQLEQRDKMIQELLTQKESKKQEDEETNKKIQYAFSLLAKLEEKHNAEQEKSRKLVAGALAEVEKIKRENREKNQQLSNLVNRIEKLQKKED